MRPFDTAGARVRPGAGGPGTRLMPGQLIEYEYLN